MYVDNSGTCLSTGSLDIQGNTIATDVAPSMLSEEADNQHEETTGMIKRTLI